jgi:hypothetical protein
MRQLNTVHRPRASHDPADWSAPAAPWPEPAVRRPTPTQAAAAADHFVNFTPAPGQQASLVQAAYETLADELDLGEDEPEPEGLMPTLTRLLLDDYELRVLAAAVWKGKAGLSEKSVLLAHKEAAHAANSYDGYSASQRRLSERSGRSLPTTNKANRRLLAKRFLELVEQGERADDEPFRYRLKLDHPHLPAADANLNSKLRDALSVLRLGETNLNAGGDANLNTTELKLEPPPPCRHVTVQFRVVWDEDGLGRMAHEVWDALARIAPATVADLVKETRRAPATVRKMLRELERHKLAAHGGNQWTWLERDLDELAAELGAGPLRERRRQRYAADREARQERKAEREREREQAEAEPKRLKRPSLARDRGADLVAASQADEQRQIAAAAGRRGQRSPLPRRRAVCQGPERHEQWFSEATLGHLSCSACGARFGWAA